MMNAANTLTATVVSDPSEISITSLKTAEKIQNYLNTVSIWCESLLSGICYIEDETDKEKATDTGVYDVLQAHIEKLKLFISKIEELEKSNFFKSINQIDRQRFFTINAAVNLLKGSICFALIKACWVAIDISNNPVKKCRIYYSCLEYFSRAIQMNRNISCETNGFISEPLLAVYVNILRSILQIVKAQKKRKAPYQNELNLLQKHKEELLNDICKQNLTLDDDFNNFLREIESVLTENKSADKSEEKYVLPDWVLNEQSPRCKKGKSTAIRGKNSLQNNVRKKSKKKNLGKEANERSDLKTKRETKPIETTDSFLSALSAALRQFENRQNKNDEQAHRNLEKNTESKTENRDLPPSNPFNAEEAKRFLQERWKNVEEEAKTNPDVITILDSDEPLSFINK